MDSNGVGASFYPSILAITDKERINYLDGELSKPPGYRTRKVVVDHHLQNSARIVVTDDGFIGIFNNNQEEVLKILNIIFATGVTFGIGGEFVTGRDLCRFKLTDDQNHVRIEQIGGPSERVFFYFMRDSDSDSELSKWRSIDSRRVTSINDVKKLLDRSHNYLAIKDSKSNLYEDLLLGLEGFSLYYRPAYKAAYVYGWMIIETVIDQMWKEYVDTMTISSDDKKTLKESSHWTTQHHIEMLYALKKISVTNRNLLTKLRKKRNSIIHEKKPVTWEEAFWCLHIATITTLNRMLGNVDVFHDPTENPLIKLWNCDREEK